MVNRTLDRIAVITGANGSLGRQFSRRLALDGYTVVLADLNAPTECAAELSELGGIAYSESVDLADSEAILRFTAVVLARFGRCDILINNAAYMPIIPFGEVTLNQFRLFESVNVEAPFLLAQQFAPAMSAQGWGRIVQITSSTVGVPTPGFTPYIVTKLAGVGLVRALASELGPFGITVNGISPGLTRTNTSEKSIPSIRFDEVRNRRLIHKDQRPEDLCGALAFLVSDDAAFITGQILNVDGGFLFS